MRLIASCSRPSEEIELISSNEFCAISSVMSSSSALISAQTSSKAFFKFGFLTSAAISAIKSISPIFSMSSLILGKSVAREISFRISARWMRSLLRQCFSANLAARERSPRATSRSNFSSGDNRVTQLKPEKVSQFQILLIFLAVHQVHMLKIVNPTLFVFINSSRRSKIATFDTILHNFPD